MDELLRSWLERLERWVGLHPVAGSRALVEVADEIVAVLAGCGLTVERHGHESGDLIVARGGASAMRLGIYGHHDVEPGGARVLQVADGRVNGRGVADNLGPLALRLAVLERRQSPVDLLWVIEPGEENGSRALAAWIEEAGAPRPALWLDETGYFEADGSQRVLAVELDRRAHAAASRCAAVAAVAGRGTRVEARRLRRVVASAGFSVESLFHGVPYLALGPNDDRSDAHGPGESLPLDTIALAAAQFDVLLETFSQGTSR